MRYSSLVSVFLWFLSLSIFSSSFAAGNIPRDSLRLELLLATGSTDTSGNNRIVTSTWLAPVYATDTSYGIPHAKFASGGLRINTAWVAAWADDYSISFWIKLWQSDLKNNSWWLTTTLTQSIPSSQGTMYTTTYSKPQVIFSTRWSIQDTSSTILSVLNNNQCSFRTSSISSYPNHQDNYSYFEPWFNCQSMLDGKWHHILISRKGWAVNGLWQIYISPTTIVYLDGTNLFTTTSNTLQINKYLTIGSLGIPSNTGITNYYQTGVLQDVMASHYFRGGLAGFRIYSRALTDAEREALGDEYRYWQSDLSGTGNIQLSIEKYTRPELTLAVRSVPLNLSTNLVTYEYSTSTGIFIPITTITDISTGTSSLDYRMRIDLTNVPDGRVNVALRVRTGSTSQNIGSVGFNKYETNLTITINQPNLDLADAKTITAFVDNAWVLSYSLTRWTVCDGTLGWWEDYSDLTFTTKADNGIRVCYRATVPSTGKSVYKLSAAIQGIQALQEQITSNTNFFANLYLWRKSAYPNPNDSAAMLLELLGVSAGASQGTINGMSVIDVNGDGLVDFVYSRNDPVRRAIIVNNGNYTFKIVYKCATSTVDSTWYNTPLTYYGDCADPSR